MIKKFVHFLFSFSYENRKTQEGHTGIIAEESMAFINVSWNQGSHSHGNTWKIPGEKSCHRKVMDLLWEPCEMPLKCV